MQVFDTAENILNSLTFGGSGGVWQYDWSAYSTVKNWAPQTLVIAASSWGKFLDVAGTGVLTFARACVTSASSTAEHPDVRVTVDGTARTFSGAAASGLLQGNLVLMPIPFKNSLKVEVFNRNTTTAYTFGLDYTYLLKQSAALTSRNALLSAGTRAMVVGSANSSTLATLLSVTGAGYLLGVEQYAMWNTQAALGYMDISIDGVQVMTDRVVTSSGLSQGTQRQGLFVGPLRFNTSLLVRTRYNAAGSSFTTHAQYTLD